MPPTRAEIDHISDLAQEFQQILKEIIDGSITTKEEADKRTKRVKEIGIEIKQFKEKYPKCLIR
jgi:hypothetical protein